MTWRSTGAVAVRYRLSNGEDNVTLTEPLAENTWHHIASSFDGSVGRIYVNGVQVGTTNVVGSIGNATTAFTIGAHSASPTGWGYQWQGMID